ncbi:MAG: hypothetical protein ABSG13_26125 [Bryobacteraceae bacterium]
MTIIAGFRSTLGVVLCSDTQETIEFAKRHVAKLKVYPRQTSVSKVVKEADLAVAFCGAGYGPFIDLLTRKAWKAAKSSETLQEACDCIEKSIKDTYSEYQDIYQAQAATYLQAELLYGVKMQWESHLFSAVGPMVNPVDDYYSGGQGHYMADFLASRMYDGTLDVHQCVILAAYILLQAKEHVDGCGGASHIAVLRNTGESGRIDQARVEAITQLLELIDRQAGEMILDAANLHMDQDHFEDAIKKLQDHITHARNDARDAITHRDQWREYLFSSEGKTVDPLGFLIAQSESESDPQESETS